MKRRYWFTRAVLSPALLIALLAGCSANSFEQGAKGAAAGAASASIVGALTDLIVDGEINTHRLERNLARGAVAGAAAGAAKGHHEDQRAAAKQAAPQVSLEEPDQELINGIGQANYDALTDLLYFRYEDAYRRTLGTVKSTNVAVQEAGFVIQAMIDEERGNAARVDEALSSFLDLNTTDLDHAGAVEGLEELLVELEDERKVMGIQRSG